MTKSFDWSIVASNFDTSRPVFITGVVPPKYWAVVPLRDGQWVMDEMGVAWWNSDGTHFVPWTAIAEMQQELP